MKNGKASGSPESNEVGIFLPFLSSTYFVIQVSAISSIPSQVSKVQDNVLCCQDVEPIRQTAATEQTKVKKAQTIFSHLTCLARKPRVVLSHDLTRCIPGFPIPD